MVCDPGKTWSETPERGLRPRHYTVTCCEPPTNVVCAPKNCRRVVWASDCKNCVVWDPKYFKCVLRPQCKKCNACTGILKIFYCIWLLHSNDMYKSQVACTFDMNMSIISNIVFFTSLPQTVATNAKYMLVPCHVHVQCYCSISYMWMFGCDLGPIATGPVP